MSISWNNGLHCPMDGGTVYSPKDLQILGTSKELQLPSPLEPMLDSVLSVRCQSHFSFHVLDVIFSFCNRSSMECKLQYQWTKFRWCCGSWSRLGSSVESSDFGTSSDAGKFNHDGLEQRHLSWPLSNATYNNVAGLIVESGITWAILTAILCEVVCVFGLESWPLKIYWHWWRLC